MRAAAALLAVLVAGGCRSTTDSLGFTQALFDDSGDEDLAPETAAQLQAQLGATHPYVVEMALAVTHGGALGACDDAAEFAYALDFILDGLDRLQGS